MNEPLVRSVIAGGLTLLVGFTLTGCAGSERSRELKETNHFVLLWDESPPPSIERLMGTVKRISKDDAGRTIHTDEDWAKNLERRCAESKNLVFVDCHIEGRVAVQTFRGRLTGATYRCWALWQGGVKYPKVRDLVEIRKPD